jgi:hypothetical protein
VGILATVEKAAAARPAEQQRAAEFVAFIKFLCATGGEVMDALALAEQSRAPERTITILKNAVSSGSTSTLDTLYDYQQAVGGFLASLQPFSAFDAILSSCLQLPLHTRISVTTTGLSASRLGELSAKPIGKLVLGNKTGALVGWGFINIPLIINT